MTVVEKGTGGGGYFSHFTTWPTHSICISAYCLYVVSLEIMGGYGENSNRLQNLSLKTKIIIFKV